MTTRFSRLFILISVGALVWLWLLVSLWGRVVPQAEAAQPRLAALPPEAWSAISRILGQANAHTTLSLPWSLWAKLTASDGTMSDVFGSAIAISGDTIVVGAGKDNNTPGSAYIFAKPVGGWTPMTETVKLIASDGTAYDWFGYSVAIEGDTIVVGAPGGPTSFSQLPGAVYVFVKPNGGWVNMTQTAKLTASDGATNDRFGYDVTLNDNGDTIVVGAPLDGSAYVFVKPGGGWFTTTQTAKLTSSAGPTEERLGYSVVISGDTLITGALGFNSGQDSAHVFVRPGGGWITTTQTAKLTASDGAASDEFGFSLAFDGNTAIIGAMSDAIGANSQQGSAYVFVKPGGGWITSTQIAKLTASDGGASDLFGWSVALSGDRVVVGSVFDNVDVNNDQGSVYIFDKPIGGWADMNETAKITAADGAAGDGFGWSVALEGDTLAVGAYTDDVGVVNQGSAYVFFSPASILYLPLILR